MAGGSRTVYSWETKVSAASAVVDEGASRPEAMERFGVASASSLDRWCRAYREGGAGALAPRPRGRPRGRPAERPAPTREQELERQVERLEAKVAYLEKSIALKAARGSRGERGPLS